MKSTRIPVRAALLGAALSMIFHPVMAQVNPWAASLAEKLAANEQAQIGADAQVVGDLQAKQTDLVAQQQQFTQAATAAQADYQAQNSQLQTLLTQYQQQFNTDQSAYQTVYAQFQSTGGNDADLKAQLDGLAKALANDQVAITGTQDKITAVTTDYQKKMAEINDQLSGVNTTLGSINGKLGDARQTLAGHVATTSAFWKGGSGTIDQTSANWNVKASSSGPFNAALGGTHTILNIGIAGSPGTLVLTQNFAGNVTLIASGYTLALNGHTLSGTFGGEAVTLDFAGAGSSLLAAANPTLNGTLTILNFDSASDVLRFGSGASALTAGQLALIDFSGYSNGGAAQIDANGYITPTGIALTSVPEPSVFALAAGAMALGGGLLVRRRRAAANPCAACPPAIGAQLSF